MLWSSKRVSCACASCSTAAIQTTANKARQRALPLNIVSRDAIIEPEPEREPASHDPQPPLGGWAKITDLPVEVAVMLCVNLTWTDFMSLRTMCRKMKWLLDEHFVSRTALRLSFDERGLSDFRKFAENETFINKLTTFELGNRVLTGSYALTTHFTSLFGMNETSEGSLHYPSIDVVDDATLSTMLAPSYDIRHEFAELMPKFANIQVIDMFQGVFQAQYDRTDYDGQPVFSTLKTSSAPLEKRCIYRGRSPIRFGYHAFLGATSESIDPSWTACYMLLNVLQLSVLFPKLQTLRLVIPTWSEPSGRKLADLAMSVASITQLQELAITMDCSAVHEDSAGFFAGLASLAGKGMLHRLQVLKVKSVRNQPADMDAFIRLLQALSPGLTTIDINVIIDDMRCYRMLKFLATIINLPNLEGLRMDFLDEDNDDDEWGFPMWSADTHAGVVELLGPYLVHVEEWWSEDDGPHWGLPILEDPIESQKVMRVARKVLNGNN